MADETLHVVLGAGGNIGRTLVRVLTRDGARVRAVRRSLQVPKPSDGTASVRETGTPGVERVAADALDPQQIREAVAGAGVVYHCIGMPYPLWRKQLPVIMRNVIEAVSAEGSATKLVYADNLYAHGKTAAQAGPLTEDSPYRATGKKGLLRARLAKQLMEAHEQGRLRASIGRASDFFGPGAENSVLHRFVFPQLLAGKPVRMFADPQRRHSYMYLPDFAAGLAILGRESAADGAAWNLPHDTAVTTETLVRMAADAAGIHPTPAVTGLSPALLALGALFDPMAREFREVAYQQRVDWLVDSTRFERRFGVQATSLARALSETVAWYREWDEAHAG
jgi:nucleoside-diphosphate-sugar epimerase